MHWNPSANYSDLPWDEAVQDGGRSYFEPQNDFLVEEVLGLGNNTTNTVRLKSVNKLYIPYKDEPDYLYLTLGHMNEDNLKQVKNGDILKKGTKVLMEGTDGFATGNHLHITANLGKYYGFLQNSNGAWCFTYEKALTPIEAFYLDRNYTKVISGNNYNFITLPKPIEQIGKPIEKDTTKDQIEILTDDVLCRETPSLSGEVLGILLPGIYEYNKTMMVDDLLWVDIGIGFVESNSFTSILFPKTKKKCFLKEMFNKIILFFKGK